MARKTNPAASLGCLLMVIGFVVTMAFDLIGGIIIFVAGLALGLIGVLAGIISDIFGLGKDEDSSRIIVVEKPEAKESRTDDDGYNRDIPAYLREPTQKSPKPKRPQPKRRDAEDTDKK